MDKKSADIVFFDALVPGERDYSAILTKIKGVKPDAILFTGYYPEAGLLLRQMHFDEHDRAIFYSFDYMDNRRIS